MYKVLGFFLAVVAVLGMSTAQVLARGGHGGGHHGGGHHGGGHHGGHHSHHSSHSHHHTGHHSHTHHGDHHHYHHSNWAHHNRPFSHGWYGRHGGAWGYGWGGWGWGNPWAVATFGATAAWLGLDAAEPIYGNYGTVDNYLTSDEAAEPETDDVADNSAQDMDDDPSEPEEQRTAETDETPSPITPEQIAAAKELVSASKTDPPKDTAFLPLGVFSLAPEGQHEANALVQLAVSKAGQIRGTYYDLLTDHDQPIRGAVDKKTQQVAFSFGEEGKVTFETSLANLTQPTGAVAAHFENGRTTTWTLARYAKEPSENEDGGAPAEPQNETALQ